VATVVADNDVRFLGKPIHNPAFSLVAPLRTNHDNI
jgi:hypothetical protein